MSLPEIQLQDSFPAITAELSSSPDIGKLVDALAKAALKFETVTKSSANPYYKSKYADLESVIKATRSPMAEQGLVVIQMPSTNGKDVTLTSLLAHTSGQWIKSTVGCPAEQKTKEGLKFDAQTIGSAITYLRRYALQALVNLAADDDDGNAATGKQGQTSKPHFVTGLSHTNIETSNEPRTTSGTFTNVHGLEVSDEDLPDFDSPPVDPLPNPAQSRDIASRLKVFAGVVGDSRKLKNWVEKRAGKDYKSISFKQFQDILVALEAAQDVSKLIEA